MAKIDVFAHMLLPGFYEKMLAIEPRLPELFPFIQHPLLTDLDQWRQFWDGETQQALSYVNVNPEANAELAEVVAGQPDMYVAGVAMVPMNYLEAAVQILEEVAEY